MPVPSPPPLRRPPSPQRGDIYWVDFDPARGSEQAGHRPAVVISLDSFNSRMPTVTVAAMTTRVRETSPITVTLQAGDPLPDAGDILGFQVMTIDQSRLERFAGRLRPPQMAELNTVLARSFGLLGELG
ncbi:type II toxin-antitoxin system PemK/MazF family toxin [Kitasatospora sp. NPDC048239]|uniref:type II toxin-antitoxin system PemK/MazF family toxin n=1 Tax=Kitasatospora sp. NPDC048239 TaxID=3364046 RepID=UPI0037140CA2